MKQFTAIFILLIAAIVFLSFNSGSAVDSKLEINPIIGDISFVSKFGYKPDVSSDNELRIRTHLEYIENLLRQKDVSDLTTKQQSRRNHLLDLLHDYWTAGIFPRNYDFADQRIPCFIDKDKRICAVGYLIEQTTSRKIAEQINSSHKYETILAMHSEEVNEWIASSGLTKIECAMIQPNYGPTLVYTNNYISNENAMASSYLGGLNLSLSIINTVHIANGTHTIIAPTLGILSGVGQIIYGVSSFPEDVPSWQGLETNQSQKTLSMANISLGTTTLILSTWNLIANRKQKSKPTAYYLYNFKTDDHKVGLALSYTRRF